MLAITFSLLYFFSCSQCFRRFGQKNITRGLTDRKEQETCAGEKQPSLSNQNLSRTPRFKCSRDLSADGAELNSRCSNQVPLEGESDNDAWCREYYTCGPNNNCRGCYFDQGAHTCADAVTEKVDDCKPDTFGESVASTIKREDPYLYSSIKRHAYPLQKALGFADRMMKHDFLVGWHATHYREMFISSVATVTAPSDWTSDESKFPRNSFQLLGENRHHALFTRGDLPDKHKFYSTSLQMEDEYRERMIDVEWMEASLNMFQRVDEQSVLYFLSFEHSSANEKRLCKDNKTLLTHRLSDIINGYIKRLESTISNEVEYPWNKKNPPISRHQYLEGLLNNTLNEYSNGWNIPKLLDSVLLILAIGPSTNLPQHVCLTTESGAVHEDDKRFTQGMFGRYGPTYAKSWDTDEYAKSLREKIQSYNAQRYFEPLKTEKTRPQLRISPVTPSDSAHALAMPFYQSEEHREAWQDMRDRLKGILA